MPRCISVVVAVLGVTAATLAALPPSQAQQSAPEPDPRAAAAAADTLVQDRPAAST